MIAIVRKTIALTLKVAVPSDATPEDILAQTAKMPDSKWKTESVTLETSKEETCPSPS